MRRGFDRCQVVQNAMIQDVTPLLGRMRYVLVSDVECRGGAGIAAGRLASALVARGHDVHWVAARPGTGQHAWHSVPFPPARALRTLHGLVRRGPEALRWHLHGTLVERPLAHLLHSLAPDVVNLHNVHGARWRAGVLDAVPASALAIWTLHDMWTLTGRCAYAYDCRQFLDGCTATCPTPAGYPALAARRIAPAWAERSDALGRTPNAVAVAPSRWLAREAKAGLWRQHRVAHIPNGVPSDVYFPVARAAAREALGLDARERVVVVMAENLSDRRKGWNYLHGALEQLHHPPLHVLLVGGGSAHVRLPSPHRATSVGRVDDAARQRLLLSAAECLVHPAPVDNLPNVVLEALACGLPTVAFNVGGLPDMVRPGVSGWLARAVTAEALSAALGDALATLADTSPVAACRALATTEYAPDLQARRYEQLADGRSDDMVTPAG